MRTLRARGIDSSCGTRTTGCLVRHLRHHEDSKECERLPDRGVSCSKQTSHPELVGFHCAEVARDNSIFSRPQKFCRRTCCPGLCFGNPWIFPFRDEWLTAGWFARPSTVRVTPLGEKHSRCQSTYIRKSLTDRNLGASS